VPRARKEAGGSRILRNGNLLDCCVLPNVIRVIK
jgi:hypothetical protein